MEDEFVRVPCQEKLALLRDISPISLEKFSFLRLVVVFSSILRQFPLRVAFLRRRFLEIFFQVLVIAL